MKRYNALYYLLFIMLVMGAFASMAQNSYGLKIMGGVALAFGFVFLIELISTIGAKEKKDGYALAELVSIILFAVIFGCRVFNIRFPYIEWMFVAAGAWLILFYARKLIIRYRRLVSKNKRLAWMGVLFHLSIILFLVSLILVPFAAQKGQWAGMGALAILVVFFIGALLKKDDLVDGQRVTAFQMVMGYRDHSIILVSIFLLFALYTGFNRIGVLPGIYSDEYPRAYFKLVDDATSGKEKPVKGKYKYQEFMEKYKQFLDRNGKKK